ncbi:hypothetical protein FA95DRAFT_1606064 [Auriscalpium vulgare]|uniref:Uncharacterized protein n=1 Tax=Auriscalpium vulgare TaxID=40419 RepID=A0ACB8RT55_9AGAM|nr:hypothetical protein FA95DRAFT_1606064 [Auriscalpium vulgare]
MAGSTGGPTSFTPTIMAYNAEDFVLYLQPCALPLVPALFNGITPTFTPEVGGRVLGRFLCEAPGEEGVDIVTQEINRCVKENDTETQRSLASLASFYIDIVLKTFVQYFEKLRKATDDSYEEEEVAQNADLFAKASELALAREDNRSMLTRLLDYDIWSKRGGDLTIETTFTATCHIIPHQMVSGHNTGRKRSVVRAILEKPGLDMKPVDGEQINDLENILTLDVGTHKLFAALEIWFTPVEGRSNTYRVEARNLGTLARRVPENPITFTSTNPKEYPLPDPLLLSLQRTCARVMHLSGAGVHIWKVMEVEELMGGITP